MRYFTFAVIALALANGWLLADSPADFQAKMEFAKENRGKTVHPGGSGGWGTDADSSHSWDAIHYNIRMEFFPAAQAVDAEVTITGVCCEAGMDSVPMHLVQGVVISSIMSAGQPVGYLWEGQDLYVELDRVYSVGDTFQIVVSYAGTPPRINNPNALGGMGIFWGNIIYTYTDPEGARAWFPCYDKPFDKASYSAQYTLPESYIMASNGHLDSTVTSGGETTTYWTHNYPIETYLISISASNYAQFEDSFGDIPLQYYVYPAHLEACQFDFANVPDMMQCYEFYFGDYPFEKYGMAEGPIFGGGGAMEHQTMTSLGFGCVTGTGAGEFIIAHELAHMWFGDAISVVDWPHIWLSEGFASYAEPLWAKYQYGYDYFIQYAKYMQDTYFGWENATNRHSIYNPPSGYLFSPVEYEKASSVLHMLDYYMGEDAFMDMMRDYFATYKYGLASTDDFQAKCEEYYGGDLDWFFQQWIYGEGYPIFNYLTAYNEIAPGHYEIMLSIGQAQYPAVQLFSTDIDVRVYSGGLPQHTETILLQNQFDLCNFDYFGPEPDSIILDPEYWILAQKNLQGMLTEPSFSDLGAFWMSEFIGQGEADSLIGFFFNQGAPASNLRGTFTTDDQYLSLPYNQINFGNIGFMEQVSNLSNPVPAVLAVNSPSHYADIALSLEWDGGDTILVFPTPVGNPTILYVDDDDSAPAGLDVCSILDSLQLVHRNWDTAISGLPAGMDDYEAMIWDCGHSQTAFTDEEVNCIKEYLDNGGRLLMNGVNVASANPGSTFLSDYLGMEYASTTTLPGIYGVPGDPVSQNIQMFLNTNQSGQDIVNPVNGGIVCFKYMGNPPAGVRMEDGYKTVGLAFDLADARWDLPSFATPDAALNSILAWLDVTVAVSPAPDLKPAEYRFVVYPNPFNSQVRLDIQLDREMPVEALLFNIQGQEVQVLLDETLPQGIHSVKFKTYSLPSGIYFVRLQSPGYELVVTKIVLMK